LVITANYGDVTRTASLMLLPDPTIPSAVTLTPLRVTGGNSAQGRVTLGGAAPRGGTVVTLRADDASIATVPERVTVPTGARSAFFLVRTRGVRDTTAVSITATRAATSVSAPLTLLPPVLTGLTLKPSLVRSGSSTLGQVTLSGPAPDGGAVIALASGNPDVATVPASITVPAGATSATFPVGTQPSGTSASLPLTASFGSVTRTVTLRTLRNFSIP
jgi:hypothetical protein